MNSYSFSIFPEIVRNALCVRQTLPVIPWAILRIRNEHSRAFRGRYDPENAPWGVEIVEAQYWAHVRTVDVVGPPQSGKTFHACELPVLFDLLERRETVFYLNGNADSALNMWSTRWSRTVSADPVLREQRFERMQAGRWGERHFRGGGLLYSVGPDSATALSQRESRIVRCSELEKTRGALGNEASSYKLATDRAAAYPATSLAVTDCTVTVREGLSWKRFVAGDRSRPYIPCPSCGRYACPAQARHIEEPDLDLTNTDVHLLEIPELASSSPSAAEEQAKLICKSCRHEMTTTELRQSVRAVVWVPVGCKVLRDDDPKSYPIPRVKWLDNLNAWRLRMLNNQDVIEGRTDPERPPAWTGPRLPEGVRLAWDSATPISEPVNDEGETSTPVLPGLQRDPRQAQARSFWFWRILSPRYTIGQVAREIIEGELGELDDQKQVTQKCLVLPWKEPELALESDLDEAAVLACVGTLPQGIAPADTVALTAGIDIGDDVLHWTIRAWTESGECYTIDHGPKPGTRDAGPEWTRLRELRAKHGLRWNPRDRRFVATRSEAILEALTRVWNDISSGRTDEKGERHDIGLTYIDAGYMSDEIYGWCKARTWLRVRPSKGLGGAGSVLGRKHKGYRVGHWTDACERRAAKCRNKIGQPMRHQYYDPKDPRRLMFLNADHWKREVQNAIRLTVACNVLKARGVSLSAPADDEAHKNPSGNLAPWWHLHAGVTRSNRYVSQVVAERWETWTNPRTGRTEEGWREYQGANHLLDCEAMATAAAAALGLDFGVRAAQSVKRAAQLQAAEQTPVTVPVVRRAPSLPVWVRRERY